MRRSGDDDVRMPQPPVKTPTPRKPQHHLGGEGRNSTSSRPGSSGLCGATTTTMTSQRHHAGDIPVPPTPPKHAKTTFGVSSRSSHSVSTSTTTTLERVPKRRQKKDAVFLPKRYHGLAMQLEPVPGTTILQNELLHRYGGMDDECPDVLFIRIPEEDSAYPSSLQLYERACEDARVEPVEELSKQLCSVPGRFDLDAFTLAGFSIGDAALKVVVPVLQANKSTLRILSLRSCYLHEGVNTMLRLLTGAKMIHFLDISSNCQLASTSGQNVLDFAKAHPTLQRVAMQKTSISKEMVKEIQQQLEVNRQLCVAPPPPHPLAMTRPQFDEAVVAFNNMCTRSHGTIELEVLRREMPHSYVRFQQNTSTTDPPPNSINFLRFLECTYTPSCVRSALKVTKAALLRCIEAYSIYTPVTVVRVKKTETKKLRDEYRQQVIAMFTALDVDGDGFLSRDDLHNVLPEGVWPTVDQVLKNLGTNRMDKKTFAHQVAEPYLVDQRRRKRWKA